MKQYDLALILTAFAAALPPAFAASNAMPGMAHRNTGAMSGKPVSTQGFMAHGTINGVNANAGTVNITHQAIKALGWPGMTMDFGVQNKALLKQVKAGEAVNFDLVKGPTGQYLVSKIAVAR